MKSLDLYRDILDKEYEKYIVGFIDILGYSKKVIESHQKNNENTRVEELYLINCIISELSDNEEIRENIDIKAFSDCMYVFAKEENADCLFDFLKTIQLRLLCSTLSIVDSGKEKLKDINMVRGGITYGDAILNDVTFIGPAIIRAYEMESKISKYPRIIIDSNAISCFSYNTKYICIDSDGKRYIDFLKGNKIDMNFIKLCVQNIDNQIADEKDKNIVEKLQWMKRYLCDNNRKSFDDEYGDFK